MIRHLFRFVTDSVTRRFDGMYRTMLAAERDLRIPLVQASQVAPQPIRTMLDPYDGRSSI